MKNMRIGTSMRCPGHTRCKLMEFQFLQSKADLFDIKHPEQVVRWKVVNPKDQNDTHHFDAQDYFNDHKKLYRNATGCYSN